ncbi:hypothetical protein FE251_11365 [Georgenia wutianyii]|uniref:PNPLA domain-containing protein n=2 Tax=Bogoriellaceae TaxID=145358 RepID=A0ABX5VN61_9MICO|nr:hypothetical protein FE251_11365 [Georgenia wutianyii]
MSRLGLTLPTWSCVLACLPHGRILGRGAHPPRKEQLMLSSRVLVERLAPTAPLPRLPHIPFEALAAGGAWGGEEALQAVEVAADSRPRVATVALELMDALSADTPSADIAIGLFGTRADPDLVTLQIDYLRSCFGVAYLLAAGGVDVGPWAERIALACASARPVGQALRSMFVADGAGVPAPGEPTRKDSVRPAREQDPLDRLRPAGSTVPSVRGLTSTSRLTLGENFRKKSSVRAVEAALTVFGTAVGRSVPVPAGRVSLVDPVDATPGEQVVITGVSFGPPSSRAVQFSGSGDVRVSGEDAIEWTDTQVRVAVPAGARPGPVAVVEESHTTGPEGDTVAEIVTTLEPYLSAAAAAPVRVVLASLAPPALAVVARAADVAHWGPPEILEFTIEPGPDFSPGQTVTLRWRTKGADEVEIGTRQLSGVHELPIPRPPLPLSGAVTVTIPGTRSWTAEYAVIAHNTRGAGTSTSAYKTIVVRMAQRTGLALGGGGTRGDFQVGALQYLYDERGYRPDAIVGTSVGAINAVDLAMGDDPGRHAATRLRASWDALTDESSMWEEEPWVSGLKADAKTALGQLSWQGLLLLPYAAIRGVLAVSEIGAAAARPGSAIFNLLPIARRLNAAFDRSKLQASRIALRLVSVSLETGEVVQVDERANLTFPGPDPQRPTFPPFPPVPVTVPLGALASASMPGIFPALPLGNHMCVDGGVRDVVPVRIAVEELGCHEVIALRCSAPVEIQQMDPTRTFAQVMARAVLGITFDEVADDDVRPPAWGRAVTVHEIRPTFDLHDPMVVEPGLIRIAADYGWMRAADVLGVPSPKTARAKDLSDRITRLRVYNWQLTWRAFGKGNHPDPHRGFADFILAGTSGKPPVTGFKSAHDPDAVRAIRRNCLAIRSALEERLREQIPIPSASVHSGWFREWETVSGDHPMPDPWGFFVSVAGNVDAQPKPSEL